MAINKLHDEFHALDMDPGWEVPAGYPSGSSQKILSGALDEKASVEAGRGSCASIPASTPRRHSCTTIGKKSSWFRVT